MFELMKERNNQDEVIRLNQEEQLFNEGIDSTGRLIGSYSPVTEVLSGGKKKAGTHYTLFDTGTFYKTFNVYSTKTAFYVEADGELGKDEDIIDKYGIQILGLTDESKSDLAEFIKPQVVAKVKERLFARI